MSGCLLVSWKAYSWRYSSNRDCCVNLIFGSDRLQDVMVVIKKMLTQCVGDKKQQQRRSSPISSFVAVSGAVCGSNRW